MPVLFSPKEVFAKKAGYSLQEIVNFRPLPDGGAVGIIPTGQKLTYTAQEMHDFELAMMAQASRKRKSPQ